MNPKHYQCIPEDFWKGRIDDLEDYDAFRWHQIIEPINLLEEITVVAGGFGLLGFCCDKGVQRNLGRVGTSKGPRSIRKEMANLPCSFPSTTKIYDCGNIVGTDGKLEDLQESLAHAVYKMLKNGLFPIVLGGGHEIAYGHYKGIDRFLEETNSESLGIFNLDAHFDMRPYDKGTSSGTMFAQIADDCKAKNKPFNYMVAGIQQYGNTVSLFKKADALKVKYLMAKDINSANMFNVGQELLRYAKKQENIYFTLCSDVISSAYAPGVSAPQPFGLHPEIVLKLIKMMIRSGKVIAFDIAEIAPRFDEDSRSSKLAAIIVFAVINSTLEEKE
ncbi:formimidoylglutamase [Ancylomarina euxinus]|uniref:Formimidoylglutamase n=1 Tax=Ancylomarina euxinus TaxID=2283627 RepID=A0A425Y636_9BACT|nr:formimidoylglutamase [Ancylomarina euxinus]MCZ4694336.1 formimidoylglutamase [Ancylomarina euxinus]MUP14333.1 formimidoylglutamase [Ancylomarina euxinus]RRG23814.1 formimidoylglutamase [Ancylomarina euxinus]